MEARIHKSRLIPERRLVLSLMNLELPQQPNPLGNFYNKISIYFK